MLVFIFVLLPGANKCWRRTNANICLFSSGCPLGLHQIVLSLQYSHGIMFPIHPKFLFLWQYQFQKVWHVNSKIHARRQKICSSYTPLKLLLPETCLEKMRTPCSKKLRIFAFYSPLTLLFLETCWNQKWEHHVWQNMMHLHASYIPLKLLLLLLLLSSARGE